MPLVVYRHRPALMRARQRQFITDDDSSSQQNPGGLACQRLFFPFNYPPQRLGWNGRHCSLEACRNSCNSRGTCSMQDGDWTCQCQGIATSFPDLIVGEMQIVVVKIIFAAQESVVVSETKLTSVSTSYK